MPGDPFTEAGYFKTIKRMAAEVENGLADLVLMGIKPSEPSTKFGYLVPQTENLSLIETFTEKPNRKRAEELLAIGAVWNGGVFVFRLGYIKEIYERYLNTESFADFRDRYSELPKTSFDYEVAEKAKSVGVVYFSGEWKDLGTWDALSKELPDNRLGNVIENNCENTTAINELNIPVVCHGLKDVIVAASPDGILVADKSMSESIKDAVNSIDSPAKYEERSWGSYRVIDIEDYDGSKVESRIVTINAD
jgi:mannose-6-phosphate isomerase mannose-1-phosphate guanylyl transferase